MGRTDNDKRAWMLNFVEKLQTSSGTYMVQSPDVSAISAAVDEFVDALAIVQTPDGRNPTTTASKNDKRSSAQGICRQYARLIKFNAGIDDEAKIAAGIKPPGTLPEPRPCPVSAPFLTL